MDVPFKADLLDAVEKVEKTNANLEPELLAAEDARALMDLYVRAQRLVSYGIAALSRKVHDPQEVARVTGTSVGKAKETVRTGEVMRDAPELSGALQTGEVSLEQAAEIAGAAASDPGAAGELVAVAKEESFQVLREAAPRRSSKPNSTGDWPGARGRREAPAATQMSSAWCTCISL